MYAISGWALFLGGAVTGAIVTLTAIIVIAIISVQKERDDEQ